MKKVLTIGGAMQDVFVQHAYAETVHLHRAQEGRQFIAIQEGRKIEVNALEYYTGGGAINSAASFCRLGFNAESFFKIGHDQEGDFILEALRSQGICVDKVVRTEEGRTGKSIILSCESGNRPIFAYRGANVLLAEQDIPLATFSLYDLLYITSLSDKVSHLLPFIARHAKEQGKYVAVNPGTSQLTVNIETLIAALANIDLLTLNCFEATLLMSSIAQKTIGQSVAQSADNATGQPLPQLLQAPLGAQSVCFTLRQFFREMLKRGPRIVVVTNGAEGVYVTDGTHIYFHPSIKSTVVSTVGAGDAFNSTLVANLIQKKEIPESIYAGVLNASSVLSYLDSQTGLLSAHDLALRIQSFDTHLLQIFSL